MGRNEQIAPLRERDAYMMQIRRELRLDPSAYVDVIFVHREEGLRAETRCLACEGELELSRDRMWWCCHDCGYEFSSEEMRGLFNAYFESLERLRRSMEREKKQWGWVRWLRKLLGITR